MIEDKRKKDNQKEQNKKEREEIKNARIRENTLEREMERFREEMENWKFQFSQQKERIQSMENWMDGSMNQYFG